MGYNGLFQTLAMAIAPAVGLSVLLVIHYRGVFLISMVLAAGAFLVGRNIQTKIQPPVRARG